MIVPYDYDLAKKYAEGATYKSIAEDIGRSPERIRQRLYRFVRRWGTNTRDKPLREALILVIKRDEWPDIGNQHGYFDGVAVSTRVANCLIMAGLTSWKEVSELGSRARLLRIPNLGRKSYNEISSILITLGFPEPASYDYRKSKLEQRIVDLIILAKANNLNMPDVLQLITKTWHDATVAEETKKE